MAHNQSAYPNERVGMNEARNDRKRRHDRMNEGSKIKLHRITEEEALRLVNARR